MLILQYKILFKSAVSIVPVLCFSQAAAKNFPVLHEVIEIGEIFVLYGNFNSSVLDQWETLKNYLLQEY